jgi:hypothetical protein
MTGPVVARGGTHGLRDAVAALLTAELPNKTRLLRLAWGLDAEHLPDVDMICSGETADDALDTRGKSWVLVVNPRLVGSPVQVDLDPAGRPVYQYRYQAKIIVWAIGESWDTSKAARDNLCTATRLALMEYPTLTTEGGDTGYLLHVPTIVEEYGEPYRPNKRSGAGSPRVWSPGMLSYEINMEEGTADGSTRPPLGTAQTTTVTTGAVGPGQPLP